MGSPVENAIADTFAFDFNAAAITSSSTGSYALTGSTIEVIWESPIAPTLADNSHAPESSEANTTDASEQVSTFDTALSGDTERSEQDAFFAAFGLQVPGEIPDHWSGAPPQAFLSIDPEIPTAGSTSSQDGPAGSSTGNAGAETAWVPMIADDFSQLDQSTLERLAEGSAEASSLNEATAAETTHETETSSVYFDEESEAFSSDEDGLQSGDAGTSETLPFDWEELWFNDAYNMQEEGAGNTEIVNTDSTTEVHVQEESFAETDEPETFNEPTTVEAGNAQQLDIDTQTPPAVEMQSSDSIETSTQTDFISVDDGNTVSTFVEYNSSTQGAAGSSAGSENPTAVADGTDVVNTDSTNEVHIQEWSSSETDKPTTVEVENAPQVAIDTQTPPAVEVQGSDSIETSTQTDLTSADDGNTVFTFVENNSSTQDAAMPNAGSADLTAVIDGTEQTQNLVQNLDDEAFSPFETQGNPGELTLHNSYSTTPQTEETVPGTLPANPDEPGLSTPLDSLLPGEDNNPALVYGEGDQVQWLFDNPLAKKLKQHTDDIVKLGQQNLDRLMPTQPQLRVPLKMALDVAGDKLKDAIDGLTKDDSICFTINKNQSLEVRFTANSYSFFAREGERLLNEGKALVEELSREAAKRLLSIFQEVFDKLGAKIDLGKWIKAVQSIADIGVLLKQLAANPEAVVDAIDPVLTGAQKGVERFFEDFSNDPLGKIMGWVRTRIPNLPELPSEWNEKTIAKLVLDTVGLSVERVIQIAASPEVFGPDFLRLVQLAEEVAPLIENPSEIPTWFKNKIAEIQKEASKTYDRIKDGLLNPEDLIKDLTVQLIDGLKDQLIKVAIKQALSFLGPAGGAAKLIVTVYDTAVWLNDHIDELGGLLKSIKETLTTVLDPDSHKGNITESIAKTVHTELNKAVNPVLDYVAAVTGVGPILDKINGVIVAAQEKTGKFILTLLLTLKDAGLGKFKAPGKNGAVLASVAMPGGGQRRLLVNPEKRLTIEFEDGHSEPYADHLKKLKALVKDKDKNLTAQIEEAEKLTAEVESHLKALAAQPQQKPSAPGVKKVSSSGPLSQPLAALDHAIGQITQTLDAAGIEMTAAKSGGSSKQPSKGSGSSDKINKANDQKAAQDKATKKAADEYNKAAKRLKELFGPLELAGAAFHKDGFITIAEARDSDGATRSLLLEKTTGALKTHKGSKTQDYGEYLKSIATNVLIRREAKASQELLTTLTLELKAKADRLKQQQSEPTPKLPEAVKAGVEELKVLFHDIHEKLLWAKQPAWMDVADFQKYLPSFEGTILEGRLPDAGINLNHPDYGSVIPDTREMNVLYALVDRRGSGKEQILKVGKTTLVPAARGRKGGVKDRFYEYRELAVLRDPHNKDKKWQLTAYLWNYDKLEKKGSGPTTLSGAEMDARNKVYPNQWLMREYSGMNQYTDVPKWRTASGDPIVNRLNDLAAKAPQQALLMTDLVKGTLFDGVPASKIVSIDLCGKDWNKGLANLPAGEYFYVVEDRDPYKKLDSERILKVGSTHKVGKTTIDDKDPLYERLKEYRLLRYTREVSIHMVHRDDLPKMVGGKKITDGMTAETIEHEFLRAILYNKNARQALPMDHEKQDVWREAGDWYHIQTDWTEK